MYCFAIIIIKTVMVNIDHLIHQSFHQSFIQSDHHQVGQSVCQAPAHSLGLSVSPSLFLLLLTIQNEKKNISWSFWVRYFSFVFYKLKWFPFWLPCSCKIPCFIWRLFKGEANFMNVNEDSVKSNFWWKYMYM